MSLFLSRAAKLDVKRLVPLLFMLRGVLRIDVAESYLGGSNASIVLGTELSLLRASNKAVVLASPHSHIRLSCKFLSLTRILPSNFRNMLLLFVHTKIFNSFFANAFLFLRLK